MCYRKIKKQVTNGKSCVTVKLLKQNKQEDEPFIMKTVTQTILYRQALMKYSEKYGVTKAAIRYKTNRQYIYRWLKRYDGTVEYLKDRSHRPHHHPNEHTTEELKLIADMRKRNSNARLVVFWVKLRQIGYTRSVTGLYRLLRRQGQMAVKPPNPKYIAKPYEQMQYPGQRVQKEKSFINTPPLMNTSDFAI